MLTHHLQERARPISGRDPSTGARYVLYWMHHAQRVDENPALDAGMLVANELGIPLLVYSSLTADQPFASDRHFTFAMEGLQEVEAGLASRGVGFYFHLGTERGDESPLPSLARSAALVIAEDFPAPPYPQAVRALADRTAAPVWCVDAHCVVPMGLVPQPYGRAFQFRKRIQPMVDERIGLVWPEVQIETSWDADENLDEPPIFLNEADVADLCSRASIDHSIGAVTGTTGGGSYGYRRWDAFRQHGLKQYHKLRNDPTIQPPRGVSRLSPYLHFGQVSPFRIAREAHHDASEGARKFLDELITWRELAFNLCFYRDDVESLSILPDWARRTLQSHATDERKTRYDWEQLARGRTGDPLWNAAQISLLRHGELHNNVRMTWGKAILDWTPDPETALETLIDLNHRFALDGSDPASYGGLLWCLGLFDRPFGPERPVIGTVRPRSSKQHAKRMDLDAYRRHVYRPARESTVSVGVIGAGMSGLTAARTLMDAGFEVTVFDKARGPGGRMATRRSDDTMFDHGAQYFTARDPRFRRYVDSWVERGLVARWEARLGVAENGQLSEKANLTERFVGVPRMSAVTRHLSEGLNLRARFLVEAVEREGDRWVVRGGESAHRCDVLLVSAPAPQAQALLRHPAPTLAEAAAGIDMDPTWALMVAFPEPLDLSLDAVFVNQGPLSWIANNSSKPGRPALQSWVAHATPEWSNANLELEPGRAAEDLLASFFETLRAEPVEPVLLKAHRWRYARADAPAHHGCVFDPDNKVVLCGDWLAGSRVEGAFLSGAAAAGRILHWTYEH